MVSAIAKGALRPKSRFGASLQLLSEGQAHLLPARSGDLHTLTAFDMTGWHGGLASDLARFRTASALAELATRFVPPMANPELFDQVLDAVGLIEVAPTDALDVVGLRALWRLIAELGLGPSLHQCARDGRPVTAGPAALSLGDGGLLCAACARGAGAPQLPAEAREALEALLTPGAELPLLDARHAAAHRRLLVRWVAHHLGDGTLPALEAWWQAGQ
jgi:DNA repair protein RecO (recombination protein O)